MDVSCDLNAILKTFSFAVKDYFAHNNHEKTAILQESLTALSEAENWNTLEPGSRETLDFLLNLFELLRGHDKESHITWTVVDILEIVSSQSHIKECIIHSFKFVPELTKLLKGKLTAERKLKILHLIQELTYGINISWQEAHLSFLISSLAKWITGDEPAVIPIALGILVNLCYKNTPAVYTLMKCVDIKMFLKVLCKLQRNSTQSKVQVCKLLIILENVSGGSLDVEIEAYIRSTCPTLVEAMNVSNPVLMKHIISFFKEILHTDRCAKVISDYPDYTEDIEKLLNTVEEKEFLNPECFAALFDYLCCVIDLGVFAREALYPQMLRLAFNWIRVEPASSDALNLTAKMVADLFSKKGDLPSEQLSIKDYVSQFLGEKLLEIISLLNLKEDNKNFQGIYELPRLTSLILLLSQLVRIPTFLTPVVQSIDKLMITKLFNPLVDPQAKENYLFQKPIYSFYVEALYFLSALSDKETSWLLLYNELLQEMQVQMILAIALFNGNENIKKKVLKLTGTAGFSSKCLTLLSTQMAKMSKLVSVTPTCYLTQDVNNTPSHCGSNISPWDFMPMLSITQQGHLNNVLEKCEQVVKKNESSLTSSIMELYHYRIAVLEQSQRQAQASQEAADLRAAQLQIKVDQTSAEMGRLHHLLYSAQRSLEELTKESSRLSTQLSTERQEAQDLQNNYSLCLQNLRSKTVIVTNLTQELEELKANKASIEQSLQEELTEKKKECTSAKETISGLKKHLSNLESTLEALKEEINSKTQSIDSLNKEIIDLSSSMKKWKSTCTEKDQQISQLQKELEELKRMQEFISELAAGKRKL